MIEDKFKQALGELSFQIIVLQHQLEEAKKEAVEKTKSESKAAK